MPSLFILCVKSLDLCEEFFKQLWFIYCESLLSFSSTFSSWNETRRPFLMVYRSSNLICLVPVRIGKLQCESLNDDRLLFIGEFNEQS